MRKILLLLVALVGFGISAFGQFSEQLTVCNNIGEKIVFAIDGTVRVSVNGEIIARGTYTSGSSTVELFLKYTDDRKVEWEGTYIVSRETRKVISMTINRSTYTPCR